MDYTIAKKAIKQIHQSPDGWKSRNYTEKKNVGPKRGECEAPKITKEGQIHQKKTTIKKCGKLSPRNHRRGDKGKDKVGDGIAYEHDHDENTLMEKSQKSK